VIRQSLYRFWMWVAVAMLLVTIVATLSQILFRYALELPLAWTEEVSRMALVCGVYAALTPAYLRGEHVVVDFFIRALHGRALCAAVTAMKAIVFLVMAYIAWGAFLQTGRAWNMPLVALPQLSMGMVYSVQCAALVSFCVAVLASWRDQKVYLADTEGALEL
jgi:TRAP-type C4-dicarboxylate transport system permease small subunit